MIIDPSAFNGLIYMKDGWICVVAAHDATTGKYEALYEDPEVDIVWRLYGPYGTWDRNVAWAIIIEACMLKVTPESLMLRTREWGINENDAANFAKANGITFYYSEGVCVIGKGSLSIEDNTILGAFVNFFTTLGAWPDKARFSTQGVLDILDRDIDGTLLRGEHEPENEEEGSPLFPSPTPTFGAEGAYHSYPGHEHFDTDYDGAYAWDPRLSELNGHS